MDSQSNIIYFAPYYDSPENTPFTTKIGGTTYEVTTHFNTEGKENVLEQFMDLITEQKLIPLWQKLSSGWRIS